MTTFSDADLILNTDGSLYHLGLTPEQVADTVIVVGDPGRVKRVSDKFDAVEFQSVKREFVAHTGHYKGKRITVLSTGIGVDNIEIAMIELDALFNIDLKTRTPKPEKSCINIIRIGTSGAIQPDIEVGSSIVSEYGIGLDNLMLFYDFPQNQKESTIGNALRKQLNLPFSPYVSRCSTMLFNKFQSSFRSGNTVTSPGFYAPQGRKLRMNVANPAFLEQITAFEQNGFRLTNFEMETSAIYAFAQMLGHQALSVNAVLGNRARGTFTGDPYIIIDSIIGQVLDII
ncbi:MAG: nucleoside phosphorylase [Cyclobacteriaceae bacterium]|nr:nucleoside phosphorylase [Cyclobacteriaceae bacterium]